MCAYSEITDDIEKVDAARGGHLAMTAGEDVLAGQVVKSGSDNSVQPSDTDGESVVGVATQSVSSGDSVTVNSVGTVCLLQAGQSISQNDPLTSHGATGEEGQVATADGTGDFIVGVALESASSGDAFAAILTLAGEVN